MDNHKFGIQDIPQDLMHFFISSDNVDFDFINSENEFAQEEELLRYGNQPNGDFSFLDGPIGGLQINDDPPSFTHQEEFRTPLDDVLKEIFEVTDMQIENTKNVNHANFFANTYLNEDVVKNEFNNYVLTDVSNQNFEISKQESCQIDMQPNVGQKQQKTEVEQKLLENNDSTPFYINLNINNEILPNTIQFQTDWSNENSNILYCSNIKPDIDERMEVAENGITYTDIGVSSQGEVNLIDSSLEYDANNDIRGHYVIVNENEKNNPNATTIIICRPPMRTKSMMDANSQNIVSSDVFSDTNSPDIQTFDAFDIINIDIPILYQHLKTVKYPRKEKLKLRFSNLSNILKDAVIANGLGQKKGEVTNKSFPLAEGYTDENAMLLEKIMLPPSCRHYCNLSTNICSENTGLSTSDNNRGIQRNRPLSSERYPLRSITAKLPRKGRYSPDSDLDSTPIVSRPLRCLKCRKLYKTSRSLKMHEKQCNDGAEMNSILTNIDHNDGNNNPWKQRRVSGTKMLETKKDIHGTLYLSEHPDDSDFFRRSTRSQTLANRSSSASNESLKRKQKKN